MSSEEGQTVRLDENGQPLSKNALKKLLKAEHAAAQKAEKAAAKAATAPAHKKEEEILDPSQYKANREAQIKQIVSEGGNPYPHKFHVDYRIPDFVSEYDPKTESGEQLENITVSVAGRIISVRGQGKLYFYDLRGDGAKIQVIPSHLRIRRSLSQDS
jgi:lysyl-tRNA synthetase, class II